MAKWRAQWIWRKDDDGYNSYLLARKEFTLPAGVAAGTLRIAADSRYVLYLNGERLGQGPVRSWPWAQTYDSYQVGGRLREGKNVIAVLALHYGVSTFQYLAGPPGLLCQLDWRAGEEAGTVATDSSWRVQVAQAYDRLTPRISCQQAYAEVFDARRQAPGWTQVDFAAVDWEQAVEVAAAGREPETLNPRPIPFLTEEPVYPQRVVETRVVQPLPYLWSVDLREAFAPEDRTANHFQAVGALAGIIWASQGGEARLWRFAPYAEQVRFYLNGRELEFSPRALGAVGEEARVALAAGENSLLIEVSGSWHHPTLSFGLATPAGMEISLSSPLGGETSASATLKAPPLAVYRGDFSAVAGASTLNQEFVRFEPLPPFAWKSIDIEALTSTAAPVAGVTPRVENLNGLGLPTADVTTIYPSPAGEVEILVDFGRELVGFVEFTVAGPAGAVLDWNFFEGLQEGHRLYTHSLQNTLRYILRGEGEERFHSVVRRGFRYASLTVRNLTAPLQVRTLRCLLNTYPVSRRGEFQSSDALLNTIWEMCAYTTRLCMEDTFVDCPAYEQTFWVGDSRNEALINYYTFGDLALPAHCWRLTAGSLRRSPLPESQVPSGWQNILTAWSLLWVLACEEYYLYSGDRGYLAEIYPAMAETCRHFLEYLNPQGLLEITAWNMLDWAPMDTPGSGVVTHQNAWLVEALRRTAVVAQLLGETEEAALFRDAAEKLVAAINAHLWSEEAQAYIDGIHADGELSNVISQQTNTVVYLCRAATAEREARLARYVKEAPPPWVQVGSPFMLFFTFEALARQGDYATILKLIRERWGMMLERGSTTCWETFPGWEKSGAWTRSFCHAWSAGPAYFLSAYQLGVRPLAPGFKRALIAPEPVDLAWCRGRVPTPQGEITVAWAWDEGEHGTFRLEVSLPAGVEGEIQLPAVLAEKGYRISKVVITEGRAVGGDIGERAVETPGVAEEERGHGVVAEAAAEESRFQAPAGARTVVLARKRLG